MIYLLFILLLFALDYIVKRYIDKQDSESFPRPLFHGKIILHKSHNPGMMMGFLKEFPKVTKFVPLCVACILTLFYLPYYFKKGYLLIKLSGILCISGALNNVFDRLTRSYVVDYFSLPFKKIKHVVFNLSDMFIFLGAFLLFLSEFFKSSKS